MPGAARAMAADLAGLQAAHKAYFQANLNKFDSSLTPWLNAISQFKATHPGTQAATTEPVADYLLTAMGIKNLTPFTFQADIMNAHEPAPQDTALETGLPSTHIARDSASNRPGAHTLTPPTPQNPLPTAVPRVHVN